MQFLANQIELYAPSMIHPYVGYVLKLHVLLYYVLFGLLILIPILYYECVMHN